MAEGIDVYGKYQTVTDWAEVKSAGVTFVHVKLSDGASTRGDYGYVGAARKAGLLVGGYHYAQLGDPTLQAELLVNRCTVFGALDLAPVLDLEDPFVPGKAAADFAIPFLLRVQERGHRPCLYGNNAMLTAIRAPVLAMVPDALIWVARYGAAPTVGYDFWQYTSSGTVPGVSGSVDRSKGAVPLNALPDSGGAPAPSATPLVVLED